VTPERAAEVLRTDAEGLARLVQVGLIVSRRLPEGTSISNRSIENYLSRDSRRGAVALHGDPSRDPRRGARG
jgi:hypothetical protein